MAEYIEREELLKTGLRYSMGINDDGRVFVPMGEVIQSIKAFPAADVAKVVHCLDCRHKYFKDFSVFCPYRVGPLSPDGFCEHGKQ